MTGAGFKFSIALALFCALAAPVAVAREEDGAYRDVAMRILGFASANDINRISVLAFTAKGGVEKNEADYISEKIASYLAGRKKPALIERALLEKVLKEARLSSVAGGPDALARVPPDIFSVDAVVTGTVFAAGGKLKVLARLIDVKTGRVLLAGQAETEREWPQLSELSAPDFQWDSGAWAVPPPDLRDALSDDAAGDCESRKLRLTRMNSELVDAKALYWAAKMKEPGFSIRGLTRNPGTEITDPETKARFYKLLGAYYKSEALPPPGPDKLPALLSLIKEESSVADDCGSR